MTPPPSPYVQVGQSLERHHQVLLAQGTSLTREIQERYVAKWTSESLCHVLRIRTALLMGMQECLVQAGLLNIERVSMSLVTDPLAHGVESLTQIPYGGSTYQKRQGGPDCAGPPCQ